MGDLTAIGFDLDGTLFDHEGAATDAIDTVAGHFDAEPSNRLRERWLAIENEHFEDWRAGRIGFQEQRRRRMHDFLPALGVLEPVETATLDAYFGIYLAAYREAWRAFPDVLTVITALREQNIAIGVLTNGNHAQQVDKINVIGLANLVDVICTSEQIGFSKPDPRAFATLADRLHVSPEQMVFLGDNSDLDVRAARAAGMRAGLVSHSARPQIGLCAALHIAH